MRGVGDGGRSGFGRGRKGPIQYAVPAGSGCGELANIKSVSIQPAAGVYYGFGIHGKLKGDAAKVDLFKEISVPVEDGSVEGQMFKRSDFGLRFGVGVTVMKHYYAGVGYDLGLLNISKDSGEGKIKNGSFFISLGYNF